MGKKRPEEGPGAAEPPAPTLGPLGFRGREGVLECGQGSPAPVGFAPRWGEEMGKFSATSPEALAPPCGK